MTTAQEDFWFQAQKAETLRLSGAYDQAIDAFTKLNEESRDNAWVNAHLGATYLQLLDYGKAEEHLKRAVEKNEGYFWAHAQLGETYRLLAIVNNRDSDCIDGAIAHFEKAIGHNLGEDNNYAWALAHLGAVYRLKITADLEGLKRGEIDEDSADKALDCLNQAIKLIPTYAWAWGMRSTVYRLQKDYYNAYWDLTVVSVIAPNLDILQDSYIPVPPSESRRINLYNHISVCFYLAAQTTDIPTRQLQYDRAIAYANQALILNPKDLIAKLLLLIIEIFKNKDRAIATEEKLAEIEQLVGEFSGISKSCIIELIGIEFFVEKALGVDSLARFCKNTECSPLLQKLLPTNEELGASQTAVKKTTEEALSWLYHNERLTETCSFVLSLLGDLSELLGETPRLGSAKLYRELAALINPRFALEMLYHTPVVEEKTTLNNSQ